MTDETKKSPENSSESTAETPPKVRKPDAPAATESAMSSPPQFQRVGPEGLPPRFGRKPKTAAGSNRKDRAKPGDARTTEGRAGPRQKQPANESKAEATLRALRRKRGASIAELQEITGWQAHSVRGFLSGSVKKKLGLGLVSEIGKDGVRRYRIDDPSQAGRRS